MSRTRVGRNDICPCGSGKKFKKCCEGASTSGRGTMLMGLLIGALVVGGLIAGVTSFSTESAHVGKTTGVWDPVHGHYH